MRSILNYTRDQIVALVDDKMLPEANIRHWEICKALSEGKTFERVADDFKVHTGTVEYVRRTKCRYC